MPEAENVILFSIWHVNTYQLGLSSMLRVWSCNRFAVTHIGQWKNEEEFSPVVGTRNKMKDISRSQPLLSVLLASVDQMK